MSSDPSETREMQFRRSNCPPETTQKHKVFVPLLLGPQRVKHKAKKAKHDGSSPRLRGTDRTVPDVTDRSRFIPAPAGNGLSAIRGSDEVAVHPRACGERRFAVCGPT